MNMLSTLGSGSNGTKGDFPEAKDFSGSVRPNGDHSMLMLILPKEYPAEVLEDGSIRYTEVCDEPPGMIEGFEQQEDLVSYKPLWDDCGDRDLKFIQKEGCNYLNVVAKCFKYGCEHFLKEVSYEDCCRCRATIQ